LLTGELATDTPVTAAIKMLSQMVEKNMKNGKNKNANI
jgi:hypothetical protein